MKQSAATLIVFTKDHNKGLVAILNRRGKFDYERFKPENYPHYYESTAGGGIEPGENLIEGLLREVKEEMGSAAAKLIKEYASHFQHVADKETTKRQSYIYTVYIPHFPVKLFKPHRSSEGMKLVTQKDATAIKPFTDGTRDKKLPPADDHMWMHDDELEGLKRGFELYKYL